MSDTIGFIGLGVMGEPICRNLVRRSGRAVKAFDLAQEPLARIAADGATIAASAADAVTGSRVIYLCLPSAGHVRSVVESDGGLLAAKIGKRCGGRRLGGDLG